MDSSVNDQRLRLPALFEYRAAAAKRRAEAFCDAPEFVQGSEVMPLTSATFTMLYATGSAFIVGGQPREHDVRNYLWFHSRLYRNCAGDDWPRRKKRALRKVTARLSQRWRRWTGRGADLTRYFDALALYVAEINRLVDEAFADAPIQSGRPGKPLATLEGFFIHEFSSAYKWDPYVTRQMPLRQLMQLHRCIRASRGEDVGDDGEDRLLAAHLKARNDALQRARNEAQARVRNDAQARERNGEKS